MLLPTQDSSVITQFRKHDYPSVLCMLLLFPRRSPETLARQRG
jgi:hypothetical protein